MHVIREVAPALAGRFFSWLDAFLALFLPNSNSGEVVLKQG